MRVTISLPDKLGENLKRDAAKRGVSVSSLVAKTVERYLIKQKRSKGEEALALAGKVRVAADVQDMIEEGRRDDRP
jgi:metal-responsive CopG/Arc/MetJ family transcriptional regulator